MDTGQTWSAQHGSLAEAGRGPGLSLPLGLAPGLAPGGCPGAFLGLLGPKSVDTALVMGAALVASQLLTRAAPALPGRGRHSRAPGGGLTAQPSFGPPSLLPAWPLCSQAASPLGPCVCFTGSQRAGTWSHVSHRCVCPQPHPEPSCPSPVSSSKAPQPEETPGRGSGGSLASPCGTQL